MSFYINVKLGINIGPHVPLRSCITNKFSIYFLNWEGATFHVLSSNSLFQGFDLLKSCFSCHKGHNRQNENTHRILTPGNRIWKWNQHIFIHITGKVPSAKVKQNPYRCNFTIVHMLYLNSRHSINCYIITCIHIMTIRTIQSLYHVSFFPSGATLYSVGQLWSLLKLN